MFGISIDKGGLVLMKEQKTYKRQRVGKYILKVLQDLGGSASKQKIKEGIVDDMSNSISYEDAFIPVKAAKSGAMYVPFNFDFNFGLKELYVLGYIEKYNRITEISLTQAGRNINFETYPNEEDCVKLEEYWKQIREKNKEKKNKKIDALSEEIEEIESEERESDNFLEEDAAKVKILDMIKQFSPKKFESFSRKLLSKMGISFDNEKGVMMSNDHGIDGYGIFESDDFRTNKVVIQCKRYSDGHIGEPEIDKFRGVISKHSADYGIFITTTYFSPNAKKAASQVNPTITLIDGQRIVELVLKYSMSIEKVLVPYFVIGDYYFEQD